MCFKRLSEQGAGWIRDSTSEKSTIPPTSFPKHTISSSVLRATTPPGKLSMPATATSARKISTGFSPPQPRLSCNKRTKVSVNGEPVGLVESRTPQRWSVAAKVMVTVMAAPTTNNLLLAFELERLRPLFTDQLLPMSFSAPAPTSTTPQIMNTYLYDFTRTHNCPRPMPSDPSHHLTCPYVEKPRTGIGWKGLISDPDIDNTVKSGGPQRKRQRVQYQPHPIFPPHHHPWRG